MATKKTIQADKLQEVIMAKTLKSLNEAPAKETKAKAAKPVQKNEPAKKAKTETKKGSTRESKYIYPENCTSTLDRKKFRAEFRNKVKGYEAKLQKAKEGSKEHKTILKEYKEYKAKYLQG